MNKIELKSEKVYAIGDLHGKFSVLRMFIKTNKLKDTTLICCGDIGLGFGKPDFELHCLKKIFNKILKEANCNVIFFRGNHDNPERFDDKFLNEPNIKAVSDYTLVSVTNSENITKNILCIGGGLSIDRTYRKNNYRRSIDAYKRYHKNVTDEIAKANVNECYWENELPVFEVEKLDEIISSGIKIDVVASHAGPSFCEPLTKDGIIGWAKLDPEIIDLSDKERGVMDNVYNHLREHDKKPEKWVYGHYHFTNTSYIDDVKFRLIDMVADWLGDYEILM